MEKEIIKNMEGLSFEDLKKIAEDFKKEPIALDLVLKVMEDNYYEEYLNYLGVSEEDKELLLEER